MKIISLIRNYKNIKNAEIEFVKVISKPKSKDYAYLDRRYNYFMVFKLSKNVVFNGLDLSGCHITIKDINFTEYGSYAIDDIYRLEDCASIKSKIQNNNFLTKYKVLSIAYNTLKEKLKAESVKNRMLELIDEIPVEVSL